MSSGGRYINDGLGYGSDDDFGGYDSDGYRPRPGRDFYDMLDYRGDEFNSGFRAPRIAPQWRFLRDFIGLVEGRYSPQAPHRSHSDNVRLGRDVDDWWINVLYENGMFVSKYDQLADDTVHRFRTVRDATLLLGVLARVDYDAFLALLMRRGKFDVPRGMDLKHHELPRQFNFSFYRDSDPQDYAWSVVKDVFGDQHYGEEFTPHLASIEEAAKASGDEAALRKRLYAPIKIKLTVRPEMVTVREQVEILKNIAKTVMEMQQVEARHAQSVAAGKLVPPVFHLDHIDLDLREFCVHWDVFQMLEVILKTGVHVASLALPEVIDEDWMNNPKLYAAWGSFIVVALGARPLPSKRVVVLGHLAMSPMYTFDIFLSMFLSALRYTTVLKSLRIEADRTIENDEERQLALWAGLAYALFNTSSSHSVESLELSGHQITDEALAEFSRMATATDPNLYWMYSKCRETLTESSAQVDYPLGMIKKGTVIQLILNAERCEPLLLPASFLGEINTSVTTDTHLFMLVPGFGFAKVPKSSVSAVGGRRSRMSPPKRITKLVFNVKPSRRTQRTGVFVTRCFVPRLLKTIGGSLTSLALHADDLDDACIQSAIRSCPKLENLLIDSTSVQSLNHLISAYEQGLGGQPTSLDLRNVSIPKEAIEGFIERLGSYGHPLHRRLRRLSIGQGWTRLLGASTAERLDAMLANNRVLSHLYVDGGRELPWHPDNHMHNRENITGTPFPISSRLAVVGVLKKCAASGRVPATGQLSEHVLRNVFEFAGEVSYRVAVREFGIHYDDEDWGM